MTRNSYELMSSKAFRALCNRVQSRELKQQADTQAGVVDAIHQIAMHKSTARACQLIQAFNGGRPGVPDGRASGRVKALMQYVLDACNGMAKGYSEAKDGSLVLKLKNSFDVDNMDMSVLNTPWYERNPEKETVKLTPEQLLKLLGKLAERATDEDKADEHTRKLWKQVEQEYNILSAKLEAIVVSEKAASK